MEATERTRLLLREAEEVIDAFLEESGEFTTDELLHAVKESLSEEGVAVELDDGDRKLLTDCLLRHPRVVIAPNMWRRGVNAGQGGA